MLLEFANNPFTLRSSTRTFLSGMSGGFEMIAAEAVLMFQKEKMDVELVTVQPNSEMNRD